MTDGIRVIPVPGLPEVRPGDDLAGMVADACATAIGLEEGDVVVVTQKVVSKAEGRLVEVDPATGHKPLVESESVRILRRRGDLVIAETRHGLVCANAGVDLSNVEEGWAALLPEDPDRSARRISSSSSCEWITSCRGLVPRSWAKVDCETDHPAFSSPTSWSSATNTSLKNTSLNSESSVIWRSGRTSIPGELMSTMKTEMPSLFGNRGPVRARHNPQSANCA